jgi:thiol-disulfide isomerase/thioredoxin
MSILCSSISIFFLFLISVSLSSSSSSTNSAVVDLNADNFDSITSEGDWLVEFMAEWCTHCQKLAPSLEKAAKQLVKEGASTRIARIDGPEWRSLSFRFNVVGYPTFFHIHNTGSGIGSLARETRRVSFDHTIEGVKFAAKGGWREYGDLIPWTNGPFGPLAMAKFNAVYYGEKLFKLPEPLAKYLDVPPLYVNFMVAMALLAAFTGLLICCAVYIGVRERAARARNVHDE